MTLDEIRKKYPAYNHISDMELADKLHAKFYSNMDKNDFYNRIGVTSPTENQQPAAQQPQLQPQQDEATESLRAGLQQTFTPQQLAHMKSGNRGQMPSDDLGSDLDSLRGYLPDALAGPQASAQNTLAGLTDLIPIDALHFPGATPPKHPSTSYNVSKGLSDFGGFVGGSEAAASKLAATKAIPYIGKAFGGKGFLSAALRSITGSGAYAAATAPKGEKLHSGGETAALTAAFEAIPIAGKAAGGVISAIQPQKYVGKMLDKVGGGLSLTDNAKMLGQSISDSYKKAKAAGSELFNPIFDRVGNSSIYNRVLVGKTPGRLKGSYEKLDKDILDEVANKRFDPHLAKMHQEFKSNTNLKNAHNLQSDLGSRIRDYGKQEEKGTLSREDKITMNSYIAARDALKKGINSFVDTFAPDMKGQFKKAQTNWAENVAPYTSTPSLAKVSNQGAAGLSHSQIQTLFKDPHTKVGVSKVLDDLGDTARDHVAYSQLKSIRNPTGEKVINKIIDFDKKGLESYISDSLEGHKSVLQKKMSRKNMAQMGAGALLLPHLIPGLSHVPGGEVLAALAGAKLSPGAMKKLGGNSGASKLIKSLVDIGKSSYKPASKAAVGVLSPSITQQGAQ